MQVLIVGGQVSQREFLRRTVGEFDVNVSVAVFSHPLEALSWSREVVPDLVVLDHRMPGMDGLEFVRRFRRPARHRDVKLVLLANSTDCPLAQSALDAGIEEVLKKPLTPFELRARCKKLLLQRVRQRTNEARIQQLEGQLRQSALITERRESILFEQLLLAVCERDGSDAELPRRVGQMAGLLARSAGLSAGDADAIEGCAWLHNVGNIALPEAILSKRVLTADERRIRRKHTVVGYQLLKDSPMGLMAAVIALHHHECWDGTGYPEGLAGTAIPLPARVVAIASRLISLTSGSQGRPAWPVERALAFVKEQAGVLFDPALVAGMAANEAAFVQALTQRAEATPGAWPGAA